MPEFYVYDNSQADYSLIHRRECRHCNDGKGKSGLEVGPGDQFIPARSFAEAEARARALGRREWRPCEVCKPSSN